MDRRRKVELFEEIRRGYAAGEAVQGLARKHGLHRRMARQAIASAIPPKKDGLVDHNPAAESRNPLRPVAGACRDETGTFANSGSVLKSRLVPSMGA
jgi:hypothetical protein